MKAKYSIIISLTSILAGFIPLSFDKKIDNITYTIYAKNIVRANKIKEELITFYKERCYSSLLIDTSKKIEQNLNLFPYRCEYTNYEIIVYDSINKIKMTGYLYKSSPSFINYKYYFSSWISSIPEATSTNVDTFAESDQIWYDTPLYVKYSFTMLELLTV